MNGALTDECELTTTEERALSSPKWPGTIYITAKALASLSHVSSSCVPTPRTRICADSFYILEVFGVLVCQQWWRAVLRWDCDNRNQWGQHPCPLWFPLWALGLLEIGFREHKNVFKYDNWALARVNLFIQQIICGRASQSLTLWAFSCVVEECGKVRRSVEEHTTSWDTVWRFPAGCMP